jgi:hypothetical protein
MQNTPYIPLLHATTTIAVVALLLCLGSIRLARPLARFSPLLAGLAVAATSIMIARFGLTNQSPVRMQDRLCQLGWTGTICGQASAFQVRQSKEESVADGHELSGFRSDSGRCEPADLTKLKDAAPVESFTFTIEPATLFSDHRATTSGLTLDVKIPAFAPVRCIAKSRDRMFVASDSGACGWVAVGQLLDGPHPVQRKPDAHTSVLGLAAEQGAVCGSTRGLSGRDFCNRLSAALHPKSVPGCENPEIAASSVPVKVVILNAGVNSTLMASASGDSATASGTPIERLDSPLPVLHMFDLKIGRDGRMRYLLGSTRKLVGWIDSAAAALWHSTLSVDFRTDDAGSTTKSRRDVSSEVRAPRRFPVLADQRVRTSNKRPQLEIAQVFAIPNGWSTKRSNVETGPAGRSDPDWEFYASLTLQALADLQRAFDDACKALSRVDAPERVIETALAQAIGALRGEDITTEALRQLVAAPERSTMETQALLRPLLNLARELPQLLASKSTHSAKLQREVCRTDALLRLMRANQRVKRPVDGEHLIWDNKLLRFTPRSAQPYDWVVPDTYLGPSVDVPLSYLPLYALP